MKEFIVSGSGRTSEDEGGKVLDLNTFERNLSDDGRQIDLSAVEDELLERCDPDTHPNFRKNAIQILEKGLKYYGEGMIGVYHTIDAEVSRIPEAMTEKVGVLRLRTTFKKHRLTGEVFEHIITTKDNKRPLDEFMRGAAIQSIAHLKSEFSLRVPKPLFLVQKLGAVAKETGKIISGTEDIPTGAYFVMEHIPGLTPLQICDPEGRMRAQFLDMRLNSNYRVWEEHRAAIRRNIKKSLEDYPELFEIDFDKALEELKRQVEILHETRGNIPSILHGDLHDGNVVLCLRDFRKATDSLSSVFGERSGYLRDAGHFFTIDYGKSKLQYSEATDVPYGNRYEDYQDFGKTAIGGAPAFLMPDGPYEFDDEAADRRKSVHALQHLESFVNEIKKVIKDVGR